MRARSVAEVIAGEAVSGSEEQRIADMRAIASVVANRAALLGVTPEQVISSGEFDAYGGRLPPGVGQSIIDMAQEQIDYVNANGPVNNATFYATPEAVPNLPDNLSFETETAGHQYFSDPLGRAIGTSLGYRQPNLYGYAQNLSDVPTPTSSAGLLSDWSQMASEGPMTAPMGSVTAAGLLGASPSLDASATASVASLDTPSSRMGITDPGFDMSRFDGAAPSIAAGFDPGRFGTTDTASFDASRFGGGLLDPATNTASFTDQPSNLGSMPDAYAAQRGPTTGLLSADAQTVQGQAEKQLYEQANSGLLSPAMAYAAEPATPPAVQAIENQMTPSQIAGYQQFAQNAPNITNMSGITGIFDDGTAYQNAMPAEVQAPDLQTVDVADQPSIATVEGPATTPALDQQAEQEQQQAITSPTTTASTTTKTEQAPSLGDRLSKAINPGTIGGGLLGGLALGPAGGLVGGLLGNAAYNGSMGGLLGPSGWSSPSTQIGGGIANIAGIYGGGYAPGTFAVANNGATITAQPGGWSTYTNKYGVTEAIGPDGKISSYFGGSADPETESSNSGGGFFGGLFG